MAYVLLLLVVAILVLVTYYFLPVVVALVLVIWLVIFVAWLRRLFFCLANSGKVFLVCGRQRGWESFTQNNLIPALPDDVAPIWQHSPSEHRMVFRLVQSNAYGTSIPFLVLVTPISVKCHSLNGPLQALKANGKTSVNTQAKVASLVSKELAAFQSRFTSK